MVRLITYLIILSVGIVTSFAQVKSEEILIKNDGVELPGTLTYLNEKTPLIIWVHGSGGVDRDGNLSQSIKQFRDSINKEDIAFFSYDKRTSNKNNVVFLKQGVLFQDFVSDAKKVINYFKKDNRFSKIILVGHSQGSLTSMLAIENADKFISLAGAGKRIDEIVIRQLSAQNPLLKKPLEEHFKELKETGEIKEVNPSLARIFSKPNQVFWNSWMKFNPIEEIKKVTVPTLIINGNKDLQVLIPNAEALKKAKPDAEYVIIENMNHPLKDIQKDEDNIKSTYAANYPLSKELISVISEFVKK